MGKLNLKLKSRIIYVFGTSEDFAERLGVHPSVVSRVIRGRRILIPETQKQWAKILNCRPAEIFKDDELSNIKRPD